MKDRCSRCRCRRRRWIDFPPFKPSGRSAPHVRWAAKIKATRFASTPHTHTLLLLVLPRRALQHSLTAHTSCAIINCARILLATQSRSPPPIPPPPSSIQTVRIGRSGGWSPLQVGCAVYVIKLSCWIGSLCPLASGTGGGSGSRVRNRVCKA